MKERILSLNTWRENKWDARNLPTNKQEGKPAADVSDILLQIFEGIILSELTSEINPRSLSKSQIVKFWRFQQCRKENDQGLTPSCSSSFIIGPDGQPLTDEERAFLEESFCKLDNNDSILDNDDVSDEYDEFLTTGLKKFC